jgi:hypothetical protein
MYVNGKMRSVEAIPGIGGERMENDGRGEFKYEIMLHCENFCKWHNVPLAQQ